MRRRAKDRLLRLLCAVAAVLALIPLVAVLADVAVRGASALSPALLTALPKPVGEAGGGLGNAIQGSLVTLGLTCLMGLPAGILAGLYLAEFPNRPFARAVRFMADVLTGVPSIVAGLFGYAAVVAVMKGFSAIAGGVALAFIMIPFVTRATEGAVRLVPGSLREAALALGLPRSRTLLRVILPAAQAGVITGALLSVARVAGETAPLLFTAFNNRFWMSGIDHPVSTLPVQIFTYAISPFSDWQAQAWGGALVLLLMVLGISAGVRAVAWRKQRRMGG